MNQSTGRTIGLSILMIITLSACGGRPTPALTPVTVQLSWTHQSQFAGFYVADKMGYYADEGLVVTFVEGGPSVLPQEQVANGSAHFGLLAAELILTSRAEGKPLRAIAAVLRHSPRVYVALAQSGITRPQDFVGKVIALNRGGRPQLVAMMQHLGIGEDQYTMVDSTPDLAQLTAGEVDVRSVFLTNEILSLKKAGYDLTIIYPDDYGIHSYADIITTTDKVISPNPDFVLRFLRATLKGWTYAVEHPNDIGALVLQYNPNADQAFENEKMLASIPLINTGEDFIGWMDPEVWAGIEKTLREQNVLTQPVNITDVYTLQFLNEIYKK